MLRTAIALLLMSLSAWPLRAAEPLEVRVPRTDSFGDPLPRGAIARLGTSRWRASNPMQSVAFSSNGRLVAASCVDSHIRIFDFPSGLLLKQIPIDNVNQLGSIVFTADNNTLVLGGPGMEAPVYLDLANGKLRRPLTNRQISDARTIQLATNGRWAVAHTFIDSGIKIRLHDLARDVAPKNMSNLPAKGQFLSYRSDVSPDGRWIAVGYCESNPNLVGRLYLIETKTNRIWSLPPIEGEVSLNVAFTPDSQSLIMAGSMQVIRWDIKPAVRKDGPPEVVVGCRFEAIDPNIELVSDNSSVVVSPDGKTVACGSMNGFLVLSDPATGKRKRFVRFPTGGLRALAFSPDSRTLAVVNETDCTIRLFETATGAELFPRTGHRGVVNDLAFHPSGKMLASASFEDCSLRTWDLSPRRTLLNLQGTIAEDRIRSLEHSILETPYRSGIENVIFANEGRQLIAASEDGMVLSWETGQRSKPRILTQDQISRTALAVSPDGSLIAQSLAESGISLLDTKTGKPRPNGPKTEGIVDHVSFADDGRTLTTCTLEGLIQFWDLATGKEFRPTATPGKGRVQRFAATYVEQDSTLLIFDRSSGRVWRRFAVPQPTFTLTTDGRYLAQAQNNGFIMMEVASGKIVREWDLGNEGVHILLFSPDGRMVASGHGNGTILLWDTRPTLKKSTAIELATAWEDLANDDAPRAFNAIGRFLASPKEAIELLKKKFTIVRPVPLNRLTALLADLEADRYAVRETATRELEAIAEKVEDSLELALKRASPETERRVERILQSIEQPILNGKSLRELRAIEILERIGTAEARELLKKASRGTGIAARDARDSLERLGK